MDEEVLEQIHRLKREFERLDKLEKGTSVELFRSETGVLSLAKNGQIFEHFDCQLIGWACVDTFLGKKGHLPNNLKEELMQTAKSFFQIKPLTEFLD